MRNYVSPFHFEAPTNACARNRAFSLLKRGASVLAMVACGGAAHSQSAATAIYAGGSPESTGVVLASSGSGSLTPDTAHVFAGGGSLKLVTHGLFQGGIITLGKPYDLAPLLSNKNAYIQIAFLPPAPPSTTAGGGSLLGGKFGGGPPGGPGSPNTGGGLGNSAGNPFGGSTGGATNSGASNARFQKAHNLENLRVVFVTSTGKAIEKKLPVAYANDEAGWKVLSIPVSAISGLSTDDALLKQVRLYGDTSGTVYIGKIGVVTDTTRIMIEPIEEKTVTANQTYRYTVSAHGGASPMAYSWDWDDRDGIQDESQGRSASHMYRKPGDYKVTVTVTDPYGVKAPTTIKFNIHIP